ncbi:AbrB/MazE/SpoVT family DNA-binding domain-containing protein [Cytobacillus oceanisediminis]|uniref:AbrB/MazE/SpoVT family DNA-binding domain-containing protein n=1 Tax=Cytobacillus oceanisediminis TaxID=665099 RepID=UPI001FB373CF|nr:AbrB/MazE/SpoVT family DNA-binding domain-containing protein [Cytobacillus oceanisediminis]UOE58049.1 AbrB/MazE/SpoVT family DNA-binding domain-containing protein [Cytobacillus oceanisediminis]
MPRATGMVRKMDPLGRIVLPMEMRRKMHIADKDPLEIFIDGEQIILRPYHVSCSFCDEKEDLIEFKDKKICNSCLEEMKKAAH